MAQTESTSSLLERQSQRIEELARDLGLAGVARQIARDSGRDSGPTVLRAVVLGEVNHGKSTLINAIVGEGLLPTGVTPTTTALISVRPGPEKQAYSLDADTREPISPEKFDELARRSTREAARAHLAIEVPSDHLPRLLELIDTPGINDLLGDRTQTSRRELPRADVIVFVLDATQLLNRSELAFAREAVKAVGGLQSSGAHLLIAINRIDLVAAEEHAKLVEYLQRELTRFKTDGFDTAEIYLTDGRTAVRKPDDESPGVRGAIRLRERLHELAGEADVLVPARTRVRLLTACELICHHASVAARALSLERAALEREIKSIRREHEEREHDLQALLRQSQAAHGRLKTDSEVRLVAFREQLETALMSFIQVANLRSLGGHLPGAVHDAFMSFGREEGERLRMALDEIASQIMFTHGEQARRRTARALLRLGFRGPTVYIQPPSVVLEAGLVGIGVAGTAVMYFGNVVAGALMAIAGPLATVALREQSLRAARERAARELPPALDDAVEAVRLQINAAIEGHRKGLERHLQLANDALAEQLAEMLEHFAAQLDETGEQRRSLQTRVWNIERELAEIRRSLEELSTVSSRREPRAEAVAGSH
jgi:ribosome biogenesis GTPase A